MTPILCIHAACDCVNAFCKSAMKHSKTSEGRNEKKTMSKSKKSQAKKSEDIMIDSKINLIKLVRC